MYASILRKKRKDGSPYRDFFYYCCKHRRSVNGHRCDYKRQWTQEKVNAAVEEVVRKMVQNPKFEIATRKKINNKADTKELDAEWEPLKKGGSSLTAPKTSWDGAVKECGRKRKPHTSFG